MLKPQIFKANDIRGVIAGDAEWDLDGARDLGAAFVKLLNLAGSSFVMGRDMRHQGRELSLAFADGARRGGANVIDVGLTSTDQLWFASGKLGLPGVQFTASHNPARYNGIKFCLSHAQPVPAGFTEQLRQCAAQIEPGPTPTGSYSQQDLQADYHACLAALVPYHPRRRLKVVVDAGNGMAGQVAPEALLNRDVELVGLYLDLDGSFPNHPANPLEPSNLRDAQAAVLAAKADLGLVFDGDADRCFLIDERGDVVDPSVITAMIALAELAKEPGGVIVINSITSACVADAVAGRGRLVRSKVGHTYVKALMASEKAIFGGEHSAHYYFRDFWGADTGMLAALVVLELLRAQDLPMSQLVARFDGYHRSGELNSTVSDHQLAMTRVAEAFTGQAELSWEDGLTISDPQGQWWANLRPSNTEPLLRLNVEATDAETMVQLRDQILEMIR